MYGISIYTYLHVYCIYTHVIQLLLVWSPFVFLLDAESSILPMFLSAVQQPPAQETHDPVATPCCVAQDAWDHLVAGGGCGGSGPTEAQCSAAMELCLDCQAAVEYYAHNATALKASDITVDISSAKIKCALPEWNGACTGTVKGLGVGLLILTGVALLVVATAACIAFDWRLLPSLVAWQRRKLLVEAIATQDAEARTDRGSESASPSAPLPPKPVPPAPPTPTARPPAQGFDKQPDTLRIAAAPEAESLAAPTSPASLPPNEAVPSNAGEALALGRAQPELPPTLASQRRPRHYASAYALHTAFITIAVIAVVLRIAYVVARGLLVVGLQLAHTCLPELLLCILPLAWVSCTSRRPKSSTTAVPMSVAYWGPWQAIPRFTTYAVCTICTEIYSTLVAALAVARLPCNASPIAGVLLYCVGLLVAVVRAYCAVLALRLQDLCEHSNFHHSFLFTSRIVYCFQEDPTSIYIICNIWVLICLFINVYVGVYCLLFVLRFKLKWNIHWHFFLAGWTGKCLPASSSHTSIARRGHQSTIRGRMGRAASARATWWEGKGGKSCQNFQGKNDLSLWLDGRSRCDWRYSARF